MRKIFAICEYIGHNMDKKSIINALIRHYSDGNKSKFASMLGITPQAISTWEKRNTFDIELVFSKCENINATWLLTGTGEMFVTEQKNRESSGDPMVDRLLDMLEQKDAIIREQAEELGQLRERIARQG